MLKYEITLDVIKKIKNKKELYLMLSNTKKKENA